jgi:hypothetical protein
MILFPGNRTPEAIQAINDGCQVLELWDKSFTMGPDAPACFRGKDFAKLYDNDKERLIKTARRLGVRVIVVDCEDQPGRQHVDLVGGPMRKAVNAADHLPFWFDRDGLWVDQDWYQNLVEKLSKK